MNSETPVPEPRRRARIAKAAVLTLAAIALALLLVHLAYDSLASRRLARSVREVEAEVGSLDPSRLRPPKVAEEENRAPLLKAAASMVRIDGEERNRLSHLLRALDPARFAAERSFLEGIVARNALPLQVADAASRLPGSNWKIAYERGEEAELPDMLGLLQLDRIVMARAWLAHEQGRTSEAITSLQTGASIASSLSAEPVLLLQLVRRALDRQHLAIVRVLVVASPSPETLEALARIVQDTAPAASAVEALMGELTMHHITVAAYLAGAPAPAGTVPEMMTWRVTRRLTDPLVKDAEREYLSCLARAVRAARQARYQRGPMADCRCGWPFTNLNEESILLRADLSGSSRSLAELSLALLRHRGVHGAYPSDLSALDLPALPLDPFTGKPFSYERRAAGFVLVGQGEEEAKTLRVKVDRLLRWEVRS